jgi:predicted peroxiredoxin
MGETTQNYRQLSRQELNELAGEELPERAAMSLLNANVAAPVNAAVALNALSDGSTAVAEATQTAPIEQTN